VFNVAQETKAQAFHREMTQEFGGVDLVVSNAGIAPSSPIAESSPEHS